MVLTAAMWCALYRIQGVDNSTLVGQGVGLFVTHDIYVRGHFFPFHFLEGVFQEQRDLLPKGDIRNKAGGAPPAIVVLSPSLQVAHTPNQHKALFWDDPHGVATKRHLGTQWGQVAAPICQNPCQD